MTVSRYFPHPKGRLLAAGLTVGLLGAGAAEAASVHRLAISTGSGSEGAAATVQTSATGSAVQGEVAASANTSLKIPFGVLGEYDHSGSTFGIGVAGISTTGYAVGAESFDLNPTTISLNESTGDALDAYAAGSSGAGYGIYTEAEGTGDGIDGIADKGGWGGYFYSNGGIGAEGYTTASAGTTASGVFGYSTGTSPAGFFKNTDGGDALNAQTTSAASGYAVRGTASNGSVGGLGDYTGEGVIAFGRSGSVHAAIAGVDAVGGTDLLSMFTYNGGSPSQSFIVQAGTAERSGEAASNGSDVQISGDVYVYGEIYQDCLNFPATSSTSCSPVTVTQGVTPSSVARNADGNDVRMYGNRQSSPTVEDNGSARLVEGRAYVRLDPAFAKTMSFDRPYKVLVTPAGPSRGVYVTNRTPQGFEVDENPGGRSTVDFDYRIIADPFGDHSARLAIVPRKVKAALHADPAFAGLRAQAASVRTFDPARAGAQSRALDARHGKRTAPASFVSMTKTR